MAGISLEQVNSLPDSSSEIPTGEAFVRLGCTGCVNEVCFAIRGNDKPLEAGVTLESINRELASAVDVATTLKDVKVATQSWNRETRSGERVDGSCAEFCLGEHAEVVAVLNDTFQADLAPGV